MFVGPETAERGVEAAPGSRLVTVIVGWGCADVDGVSDEIVDWEEWLAGGAHRRSAR